MGRVEDIAALARFREGLQLARREGKGFDAAWGTQLATLSRGERKVWTEALTATRGAWERAWHREPPRVKLEEARGWVELADETRPLPRRTAVLG